MKKIAVALLLGISVVHFGACNNPANGSDNNQAGTTNQTLAVPDFAQKLENTPRAQLIDVRTPGEFAGSHLKNAVNMDISGDDFKNAVSALDKKKPVFVYCLSGGRSSRAADQLQDMGFKTVYNLEGGIMRWQSAGKPVETGAGAPAKTGMSLTDYSQLVNKPGYVLVDFNAPWCEPCKKMMPVLEGIADKKKDKLQLLKINADDNKQLMQDKHIDGIPHLELYKDGALVWQHEGYIEEAQLLAETKL